jgi:hypothetical protein
LTRSADPAGAGQEAASAYRKALALNFVLRGHVQSLLAELQITVAQPNAVFHNLGGIKFEALTAEAGLTSQSPSPHRGSATGELNGDGRLDVVVTAINAPAEILIEIAWPARITQKLEDVAGDRIITVAESASPGR